MVAEQAFLAPRLGLGATMADAAAGATALAATGEIGGVVVRTCRRRLHGSQFASWMKARAVRSAADLAARTAPATPAVQRELFREPLSALAPAYVFFEGGRR